MATMPSAYYLVMAGTIINPQQSGIFTRHPGVVVQHSCWISVLFMKMERLRQSVPVKNGKHPRARSSLTASILPNIMMRDWNKEAGIQLNSMTAPGQTLSSGQLHPWISSHNPCNQYGHQIQFPLFLYIGLMILITYLILAGI